MRILFVVDYYQPLLGYGSFYIPRSLTRLGHKVIIYTSDHYYPFPDYEKTVGKILGSRKVKVGTKIENGVKIIRKPLFKEIFTRAIFFGHSEIVSKFKPHVVIVDKSAGYSAVLLSYLKNKFNYKLVSVDAHLPSGFAAEGNQLLKILFYFLFRLFFSKLLNSTVDRFIAVQEATQEIMSKYYGVTKNMVHVPLGTDTHIYRPELGEREKIRKLHRINKNDFVIIYTGKVIKEKGIEILLKAFDKICDIHENVKLLIVGEGPKEYIRFCLTNLRNKYHSKVIWAGFKPALDLYKYYSASDVGVWPLQESMSMNDAAACELPFIANSTIGARLRLSNNNALLYKKGDSNDLVRKIEFLLVNKVERKAMGKRGRGLMIKKLSWDAIAKQYILNL